MKKQKIQTKISISVFILAILAMSSVFSIFAPNAIIWGNDEIDDTFNEEVLAISQGDDPWWDGDWQYRQCINVTNTGSYNLTDNWLSININYNTLVNDGKLKSDFGDIRIVENEEIRRYHIRKNFPSQNMLTIWFETNSTEGTSDFDTYLYYGNPSVSQASTYFANCPDGTTWWSFEEGESNPYTKTLPSGDWEVGLDSMQFCNVTFRDQGNDTATDGGPNYITSAPVGDYALEFDGNSNYMAINEELFFPNVRNLIDEVTITCWYKVDNALDGNDEFSNWAFFDFDRSETFNFYLRGDTGQLEMSTSAYGGGGYSDFVSNTAGLNDNTWRFGACTYDGFDKKLYIDDGVLDATLDNAHDGDAVGGRGLGTGSTTRYGFLGEGSEADVFDEPEVVGIDGRNSYYYAGALDEVRYFNWSLEQKDIEWLANYYTITPQLMAESERSAAVEVIVKDMDGRRLSGATVYMWNTTLAGVTDWSAPIWNQTSSSIGTVSFTGVPYYNYSITVNYSITLPDTSIREEIVYNSTEKTGGLIEFKGLQGTISAYTNIWTIDFEVVDVDGAPLNYGCVIVNDTVDVLANLTLDNNGQATFKWLYHPAGYGYKVYYDNRDITMQRQTLVNWNTALYDIVYETYDVVDHATTPTPTTYNVDLNKFIPGSSESSAGKEKIVDISLTLNGMNDNLTRIISDFGYPTLLQEDIFLYTGGETSAQIEYNPLDDALDVYGFGFDVEGENQTTCTGTIELNMTHTHVEYITVPMAKLTIKVIDSELWDEIPGVDIRIENNDTKVVIVNQAGGAYGLETGLDGIGYGRTNIDLEFWYLTGQTYNISLWLTPTQHRKLFVNISDQPHSSVALNGYNYTLYSATTIILEADLNYGSRQTFIENWTISDNAVTWGENTSIFVNFTKTDTGTPPGDPDNDGNAILTCTIKSSLPGNPTVLVETMNFNGNGNYTLELNTSRLSAGNLGRSYTMYISGEKLDYKAPDIASISLSVSALATGMTLHDYDSLPTELDRDVSDPTKYEIRPNHGDIVNISIFYYHNDTSTSLASKSPTVTYTAGSLGSGSAYLDPLNPNYFYLTIDTSSAVIPITASEIIVTLSITASLENNTQKVSDCYLRVQEKVAYINGSFKVKNYPNIYINEAVNFIFEYNSSTERLGDLNIYDYIMYRIEGGSYVPGSQVAGSLIPIANDFYALDVDTETLAVGQYEIEVNLKKNNYQEKEADIVLTVKKRPIDSGYTSLLLSGVQGSGISICLDLTDSSNESVALTGVTIILEIDGVNHTINAEGTVNGRYCYTFSTNKYNTFFMPMTISGTIYMMKDNHETTLISVSIVIGMPETFGIPTFYLIMIVGSIVAVVGSLLTYRTVQQRRIPTFVKKTKAAMKTIDSKGKIGESLIYPPKDEYIVKLLGERWESLGLSLGDILGVEGKKGKATPGSEMKTEEFKGGNM